MKRVLAIPRSRARHVGRARAVEQPEQRARLRAPSVRRAPRSSSGPAALMMQRAEAEAPMINRAWLARTEPAADATSSLDARRRVVDARISAIELEVRETADQLERYDRLAQEGHAAVQACEERAAAALQAAKEAEHAASAAAASADEVGSAWCAASIEAGFLADDAEGAALLDAIRSRRVQPKGTAQLRYANVVADAEAASEAAAAARARADAATNEVTAAKERIRSAQANGKSARERAEALRPKLDEARESAAALEKETDAHAWFGELLGAEEDDAPAPTGSWMPTLLALRAFVEKNTESHARTEALTLLSLTNDRGAYERFCETGGAEVVVANLHELRSPSPSTRALQVKLARLLGGETPSMRARLARAGICDMLAQAAWSAAASSSYTSASLASAQAAKLGTHGSRPITATSDGECESELEVALSALEVLMVSFGEVHGVDTLCSLLARTPPSEWGGHGAVLVSSALACARARDGTAGARALGSRLLDLGVAESLVTALSVASARRDNVAADVCLDGLVELVHATADNAAATDTHRVPAVLGARLREARASPSLCFERLT